MHSDSFRSATIWKKPPFTASYPSSQRGLALTDWEVRKGDRSGQSLPGPVRRRVDCRCEQLSPYRLAANRVGTAGQTTCRDGNHGTAKLVIGADWVSKHIAGGIGCHRCVIDVAAHIDHYRDR